MIKVKQLVHSHLQNSEKLSHPETQAKICLAFVAVGTVSLVFSLLSLHTILSLAIIFVGLALILKKKFKDVREKGLISYIPLKFHKVLLHRSLFDILCDIWFIPRLTIYIKAFIGPFIYRIKPEEAINNLEELDPGVKKALLTKGLVYLFPKSLRKFLLPKKNHVMRAKKNETGFETDSEGSGSDSSSGVARSAGEILFGKNEKKIELSNLTTTSPADNQNSFSLKQDLNPQEDATLSTSKKLKHRSTTKQSKGLSGSTPIKALVLKKGKSLSLNPSFKREFTLDKNSPLLNTEVFSNEEKPVFKKAISTDLNKDISMTKENQEENSFVFEENKDDPEARQEEYIPLGDPALIDMNLRKTKVINSSKKLAKKTEAKKKSPKKNVTTGSDTEVVITEKWDNLELFETKRQEKIQKIQAGLIPQRKPLAGPLGIITKLIEIRKNGISKVIGGKTLFKVFSLSSVALVMQFFISKRARNWLSHTIVLMFYIICFLISSGSLGLAIFKMIKERKESSAEKKKQLENK